MYDYMVLNEHTAERLGYASSLTEAREKAEAEAVRWGTQRISVWKREATFESERRWR